MSTKHKNYEILNLIGYGLAKYDINFIKKFGFNKKTAFYENLVKIGIAETTGVVKNRQDLFDPFFDNKRKGWWQKGDAYIHRKTLIDSLFGSLDVASFANVVKIYINENFKIEIEEIKFISPILKSKFRQLQETGQEAELYFMNNFETISYFQDGITEDARLFGDGYDFQIEVADKYFLTEIKGIRNTYGSIRITKNEYFKALEFKDEYGIVVVSNLTDIPKMTAIFNPIENLKLTQKIVSKEQISYHSESMRW